MRELNETEIMSISGGFQINTAFSEPLTLGAIFSQAELLDLRKQLAALNLPEDHILKNNQAS